MEEAEVRKNLLKVAPLVRSVSQKNLSPESLNPESGAKGVEEHGGDFHWTWDGALGLSHVGESQSQEGPRSNGVTQNVVFILYT